MDTCAFCSATGTDFKPEHWVSQWISRAEIGKGKGILHFEQDRDPRINRIVDLTVKHVCPECNHGWMSDIETRTRDIALPLIRGEGRTLSSADQIQLAAWCFLKAISLELGRPEDQQRTYDPEIYEGFRKHLVPPLSCLITVGRHEISDDLFVWFKSERQTHHTGPPVGDIDGYRTALVIRHLAIEVFGVYRFPAVVQGQDDGRWVEIWPSFSDGPISWPPPGNFKVVNDALA